MNSSKEISEARRTLAVGWFDNAPFRSICRKYLPRIKEVFFAWPGVTASRPMAEWTPERKRLFFEDIAWRRGEGIELDAIFNANCYGDIAISNTLADHVTGVLGEMGEKYSVSKAAVAIAWILRHPARMQAIAGTMNPDHLRDICAASKVSLTHQEWYQLYLASGKFLP
jgi:hypothetical protein